MVPPGRTIWMSNNRFGRSCRDPCPRARTALPVPRLEVSRHDRRPSISSGRGPLLGSTGLVLPVGVAPAANTPASTRLERATRTSRRSSSANRRI
jgi:hypothetical protein